MEHKFNTSEVNILKHEFTIKNAKVVSNVDVCSNKQENFHEINETSDVENFKCSLKCFILKIFLRLRILRAVRHP